MNLLILVAIVFGLTIFFGLAIFILVNSCFISACITKESAIKSVENLNYYQAFLAIYPSANVFYEGDIRLGELVLYDKNAELEIALGSQGNIEVFGAKFRCKGEEWQYLVYDEKYDELAFIGKFKCY